jgi:tetratricopeptide (TPR) repeat protein
MAAYREGIRKAASMELIADRFNVLLLNTHDREMITREWRQVHEKRPDSPVAAAYYADALNTSGRYGDAVEITRTALSRFPDVPALNMHLARALFSIGETEEGLALIDKAVAANAGLRDSATDALIHALGPEHRNADPFMQENIFSRLARLNPESAYFLNRWAEALLASGKQEEGVAVLQQAIAVKPESDASQAAEHLETLMPPEERKAFWVTQLALLVPNSIQNLCASNIADDNLFMICHYAEALADCGQAPEAIAVLSEANRCFPENVRVTVALGLLECRVGNVQAGIRHLESLLQRCPEHHDDVVEELETVMNMLTTKEQFEDNELLARFLMNVEPDNMLRRFQLAEALFQQKKYTEAITEFEYVLLHAPESPRAAGMMNEAYASLNDPEACRRAWQQIIEAHPDAKVPQQYREGSP